MRETNIKIPFFRCLERSFDNNLFSSAVTPSTMNVHHTRNFFETILVVTFLDCFLINAAKKPKKPKQIRELLKTNFGCDENKNTTKGSTNVKASRFPQKDGTKTLSQSGAKTLFTNVPSHLTTFLLIFSSLFCFAV